MEDARIDKIHCITFSKGWIRIYKSVNNINKMGVTGSYATASTETIKYP